MALVVAAVWWAVAPGGRAPSPATYLGVAESTAIQDGWFAGLSVAAGAVVALVWVARRPDVPDGATAVKLVAAMVGAVLGSLLAVAAGVGLDRLLAAAATPSGTPAVEALRLTSPAAAALWPLALVLLVLVDTVRDLAVTHVRDGIAAARERREHPLESTPGA